jgi:hypothetical protein
VSHVLGSAPLNIGFRRVLSGSKWDRCVRLVLRLMRVQLTNNEDVFRWSLTTSGSFSIRSMYLDLLNDYTVYLRKYIWKIKVSLKIRIFMWFLHKEVILTNDNCIKPSWHDCSKCCFCYQEETLQHIFFSCPFTRILWRIIFMTFSLPPPSSVANLFGNWLMELQKRIKGT